MMRATARRLVALLAFAACHSRAPATKPATKSAAEPAADTCAAPSSDLPQSSGLPSSATGARLAGEYRLRLVATAGPHSGEAVNAHLRLAPLAESLQVPPPMLGVQDTTTRYPLAGSTDLDPALVGGVGTGDNASTDPTTPGVLVIERHRGADGPTSLMLRLGALANRRGLQRFDGGYFALTVRRIDADGFAGTWASGTARQAAAGYFCAERTSL
jgi:hypothetical protein